MAEPVTRDYILNKDGTVICFKSPKSTCFVGDALATAAELTPAHDQDLARATEEINRVLAEVRARHESERRHLRFLITHKGLFLVWAQAGVTREDNEKEVETALKLN